MAAFIDKPLITFEPLAVAIAELRQQVKALEALAQNQLHHRHSSEPLNPPTEVPAHSHVPHFNGGAIPFDRYTGRHVRQTLDESDRSFHVAVGARVDSSNSGH